MDTPGLVPIGGLAISHPDPHLELGIPEVITGWLGVGVGVLTYQPMGWAGIWEKSSVLDIPL